MYVRLFFNGYKILQKPLPTATVHEGTYFTSQPRASKTSNCFLRQVISSSGQPLAGAQLPAT